MTGADAALGPKSLLDICIDFFAAQLLSGDKPPLSSSECLMFTIMFQLPRYVPLFTKGYVMQFRSFQAQTLPTECLKLSRGVLIAAKIVLGSLKVSQPVDESSAQCTVLPLKGSQSC